MSDSIKVAIKVRPLIKREKDDNLSIQWNVQGNSIVSTDPDLRKRGDGGFCFDHIFDMDTSNSDIFNVIVKPIVNAAVNGFNGTIFAYGQTSSGKTYTMMGTDVEPGIIPLTIEHMFGAIANTIGREFLLRVSYLEIYNERVNDLLNKSASDLKLKEDGTGQVIVQCKEEITNSPENVLSIMKKGDKNRRIGETNMNERSSRSHTIFRITIESREAAGDSDGAIQVSQLNLVDLAGSERARQTGATGERFKEGRHINLSLSTLGLVIMQLSESQDGQKHINFRDSKLTRLLQSSLGGNAMTAIICAVTPAAVEETQCTLSFACRAKSVKNKPQVNEVMSDAALLKRYAKQLAKLQEELAKVKNENRSAEMEEMESKLQEKDRINQLLEERIELLKTRIVSGDISQEEPFKCKAKRRQTWGGAGMRNQRLPVFQHETGLSTIKEVSFEKPRRKSIIQSIDIMNQTFQTAFADFELELFESERCRVSKGDSESDEEPFITKRKSRVTFNDSVFTIKSRNSSFDPPTPEKCEISTQTSNYHASPSTPKHVLRRCINELTKDYEELREYTTLEKQVMCQNHCSEREEAPVLETIENRLQNNGPHLEEANEAKAVYRDKEFISEVKKRLTELNLSEEKDTNRIIIELCLKLNEVENDAHRKAMVQYSELRKQIENTISERNEFEYIGRELRAELNKKTMELELKNISEESIRQPEREKISELEKRIEIISSERNQFERTNIEQRTESSKKIAELQKQLDNVTSERNEFEHMRREMRKELNKKSLELEKLKNDSMHDRSAELEKQIEDLKSEKDKIEQTNIELESTVNAERIEKEKAMERIGELEKRIEEITSSKHEVERNSIESKAVFEEKITELSSELERERVSHQGTTNKVSELEKQIEQITFEKKELEQTNIELNKNASDLALAIKVEQDAHRQAVEKMSELEKENQMIICERSKVECIITELRSELESKATLQETGNQRAMQLEKRIESLTVEKSQLELVNDERDQNISKLNAKIKEQQVENEKAMEKVSELEKQITNIISEKNELEHVVSELHNELNQKTSEIGANKMLQETENQDMVEKMSKLEKQIESLTSEKNELERISNELRAKLNKRVSEIKAKSALRQLEGRELNEMVSELEMEVENITSLKDELELANVELREQLELKTSELESKIASEQKTVETISESNKQIERITLERNEYECRNEQLNIELREKALELESKLVARRTNESIKDLVEAESNGEYHLGNCTKNLHDSPISVQTENQDLKNRLENRSVPYSTSIDESNADISTLVLNMEVEKSQLEETLYSKSQELQGIKDDVRGLRMDIKNLQDTIYLLTTENMDMATKLTIEQENAKQTELNLQKTIDELYLRISEVTEQKINLESDLATLKDQLESLRSKTPEIHDDEERMFATYQSKIDKLTAENIELSTCIAEKNKELQSIKESKSLLYDHECMYKEKMTILANKNESLLAENNELSTDLIDKIEENDMLKEQCNILQSKIEQSLAMNENCTENDVEHLKIENNTLRTEIVELKTKVTVLSEENAKFSDRLLETIEDLDSSRNEKTYNGTLHLSTLFRNTEIGEDTCRITEKENREMLEDKVIEMQKEVEHLVCLNKKLSELKLTSCSQCAHLRKLNESRRSLKLEAKMLNQKLQDLQRKFDRKCADTEILKRKINQDPSLSENNSANVSFINEMDITFVEDKIQNLHGELQTLKTDHDKLSVLYEDKCNELEMLRSGTIVNASADNQSTAKKDSNRGESRVKQIQDYVDQLRNDIDEMKKNSTNFTIMLDRFKAEKVDLLDEINLLKESNEELQQKAMNNESEALNKVKILENELDNTSREIEQFSAREKEFESQKLMLEVELENLKVELQNKNALITQLNERVSCLKDELDVTSRKNDLVESGVIKSKEEELECLKERCESLEKEKTQIQELERHNESRIKELEARINNLQSTITNRESLCTEFQRRTCHLEQLLQENEQTKHNLAQQLQATEIEVIDYKNNLEMKYKHEFDSVTREYQCSLKESEENLQKLSDTLNKYVDENMKLSQEVTELQGTKEKYAKLMDEKERMLDIHNERLKEELDDIKKCMIKELKSLKPNVNSADILEKPINEIFVVLLQTLVLKEEEVIKSVRDTCEKEKRKLEDEKQQCIDMEKRATIWAKELESEIEKLHSEIMERERGNKEYQNKISQLEHLIKESVHEKDLLREKIDVLETDYNNLQADFDKQCGSDNQQEEAMFVAQRRERELQEMFHRREMDLESKLKTEKDAYEKKLNELHYTIECYKTKNMELNGNIEGLEANEKQFKNIIEAKATEIKRNKQAMERMNAELEQLTQAYNELNQEMDQKNSHIEEITSILKSKCDILSEYKTKLEIVLPEYEMLKDRVRDQSSIIQKHKEEIEEMKREREEQLVTIKDMLNSEEIKNAGLNKQLNELNNRNISLMEEMNELKEKYEELREENAKLERKIRNSTSKIKAEAEIEELKELNKRLQSNLDGASNRVVELQEAKNQTLKDLVDMKGKYELTLQENAEIKTMLSLYESKHSSSSSTIDEGKYDALLLEKNQIALELEGKKLILNQKEKEVKQYTVRIQQLIQKNKELDEEVEEYAATIRERDVEISKLEEKLHSASERMFTHEVEEKLKKLNEENEKLKDQVEALNMRLQMDVEMEIKCQNEKTIRALKKENLELEEKIKEYKKYIETNANVDDNTLKGTARYQLRSTNKVMECTRDRTLTEFEEDRNELTRRLEAQKLLLNQKDKELKKYMNRIQELTSKNKEFDSEVNTTENSMLGNPKEKLDFFKTENKKLKSEVEQLRTKLRIHEGVTTRNMKEKLQSTFEKSLSEQEDKYQQLRNKIRELELQLVTKNGKIATLEIQIQSENFPYQRKCKELEELVLAFRNKNAELNSEVKKLQRTLNDVNAWDCNICRRWRVNRKDEACQTIPYNPIRFCSSNSGVVEEHVRIEKLEKEKAIMKNLCRARLRQIKELEDKIKELTVPPGLQVPK